LYERATALTPKAMRRKKFVKPLLSEFGRVKAEWEKRMGQL
jgi:hypothetical protein